MLMRVRYEVLKRKFVSKGAAQHYSKRPARRSEWRSQSAVLMFSRGCEVGWGATSTCGVIQHLCIITVVVLMCTCCTRSRGTKVRVGDCNRDYEDCRRSPQELFSLGSYDRAVREQRRGRWHACGRGIGRLSSVRQLGNTSL
jgi:hypothetical protein